MAIFSVFTGLIYNEAFSIPLSLFGATAYTCPSDPPLSLIDIRTNEAACPEAYTTGLVQALVDGLMVAGTLLMMALYSPGLMAVSLAWLASAAILLCGATLSSFLGEKGITAIERLMGMVLVASAVQMFLDGAAHVMRQ